MCWDLLRTDELMNWWTEYHVYHDIPCIEMYWLWWKVVGGKMWWGIRVLPFLSGWLRWLASLPSWELQWCLARKWNFTLRLSATTCHLCITGMNSSRIIFGSAADVRLVDLFWEFSCHQEKAKRERLYNYTYQSLSIRFQCFSKSSTNMYKPIHWTVFSIFSIFSIFSTCSIASCRRWLWQHGDNFGRAGGAAPKLIVRDQGNIGWIPIVLGF